MRGPVGVHPEPAKRVVVTDHAFNDVAAEEAVALRHGAHFDVLDCRQEDEAASAVDGADVVIVNFAPMTRSVMARMKPGATVIRYGIGYDNVDIEAARELGIFVAHVPDYGLETVADHTSSNLLALARRLPRYDQAIKSVGWLRPADVGPLRGFRSTVVGLIGLGRIAQAVHRRLVPFGFAFIAHDPYCEAGIFDRLGVERVELYELARRAHAISLHAPSTPETHHTIDRHFLSLLQPGTVLVNTARGPLVDEVALADALTSGQLAAAALDVFDPEPLAQDSPLRQAPNIMLSPHAAFYDEDSLKRLQVLASEEAGRALRGDPLRCRIA